MTIDTQKMSSEEMKELIQLIGKPIFNFMLKRVQKSIFLDDKYSDMEINTFISILIATLATLDSNILQWIAEFYKARTGAKIDFEILRSYHLKNLHTQLGIKMH